jgi:formylglycine-generating enzyme required for sulfatase activity
MNLLSTAICAALICGGITLHATAQTCPGDLNGDHAVDGADLGELLAHWGQSGSGDLDGNGIVNGADIGLMLGAWGACPPTVPIWATLEEARPDPAVVADPTLRAAITATGLAWRVRDTATQIEMMLIPPGTFNMGCIMRSNAFACYSQELPVHQVTLTHPFYLGRYEVTQNQWIATVRSNPSYFKGYSDSANRPVEQVSWNQAQSYLGATNMRLPTEAEWEYACRAGTQTPFYNGSTDDQLVGSLAWYRDNSTNQTHPVGGKAANGFGLYDMSGNVFEWVSDCYDSYPSAAQTDPTGGASYLYNRVIRGGSFAGDPGHIQTAFRTWGVPDQIDKFVGFRVARNP